MRKNLALIIGGTSGFGRALAAAYSAGVYYDVITLGRSGGDFQCDIADQACFEATLSEIRAKYHIDSVVCVVGYARYAEKPTNGEVMRTDWLNYGYVKCVNGMFAERLRKSGAGSLVTIGSRWSYLIGEPMLQSYINAKHKLCDWVRARNQSWPGYACFHYCVPTMDTPQYSLVAASAEQLGKVATDAPLANPQVVAQAIVDHVPDERARVYGDVYVIDRLGSIAKLG